MARRRSPAAVDVDATAVPVELLDWDHPTWRDRRAFEALIDRIDPGRRHPFDPLDVPDHPAQHFDAAARAFASANGLVDPRRPGGYVAGLARSGSAWPVPGVGSERVAARARGRPTGEVVRPRPKAARRNPARTGGHVRCKQRFVLGCPRPLVPIVSIHTPQPGVPAATEAVFDHGRHSADDRRDGTNWSHSSERGSGA